jgi:glycosyltransferase involved in cell wall biosynthesis
MSTHIAEGNRLLVYEPRVEGHHPGWLRFITEDLLAGGYQLTLALDQRPRSAQIIEESLRGMESRVQLIPALDEQGRRRGGTTLASLRLCLAESRASRAFLCEFDELASTMFRRSALGLMPPPELKGRFGGIYHRPRFMAAPPWSINRWLKQAGFRKLLRDRWLRPILFLDEYLTRERQAEFPDALLSFLPNPCPEGYDGDRSDARRALGLPEDRTVFLFYGGGYRRKGLHLAVEAALQSGGTEKPFLLCAGRLNPEGETARGLEALVARGDALLLNRYVTSEEERHCFAACDFALLPYLNHFGISAVLAQAVAAGKPVIASDEQLLGRQVRDNALGLLFSTGDATALGAAMTRAMGLEPRERKRLHDAAARYAQSHSRAAYRKALLDSLRIP